MKLSAIVLKQVPDFDGLVLACKQNPDYLLSVKEFERKLIFLINFPVETKYLVQNSNGDLLVGTKSPYPIVINRAARWFFPVQSSTKLKSHCIVAEDWSTTVMLRRDYIAALFDKVKEYCNEEA